MGCDIHSFAEVKTKDRWKKVDSESFSDGEPFPIRSYGLFGFLADVRNYSKVPGFDAKGFPDDSDFLNEPIDDGWGGSYTRLDDIREGCYHSASYLTLKELLDFDYSKSFEDRRTTKQVAPNIWNGAHIAEEGEGEITTYKEFLGGIGLFATIEVLKKIGSPENVRVVFYFDN